METVEIPIEQLERSRPTSRTRASRSTQRKDLVLYYRYYVIVLTKSVAKEEVALMYDICTRILTSLEKRDKKIESTEELITVSKAKKEASQGPRLKDVASYREFYKQKKEVRSLHFEVIEIDCKDYFECVVDASEVC